MNQLNHVAIIMDGNGRWGLKKRNSRNYGHLKGIKTVEKIIKSSVKKNIPFCYKKVQKLTFFRLFCNILAFTCNTL